MMWIPFAGANLVKMTVDGHFAMIFLICVVGFWVMWENGLYNNGNDWSIIVVGRLTWNFSTINAAVSASNATGYVLDWIVVLLEFRLNEKLVEIHWFDLCKWKKK